MFQPANDAEAAAPEFDSQLEGKPDYMLIGHICDPSKLPAELYSVDDFQKVVAQN